MGPQQNGRGPGPADGSTAVHVALAGAPHPPWRRSPDRREAGVVLHLLRPATLPAADLALLAVPATPAAAAASVPVSVTATVETAPVSHSGDAADDPAVRVHPTDPARSVVVATDKKGTLEVYDMTGARIQRVSGDHGDYVDFTVYDRTGRAHLGLLHPERRPRHRRHPAAGEGGADAVGHLARQHGNGRDTQPIAGVRVAGGDDRYGAGTPGAFDRVGDR